MDQDNYQFLLEMKMNLEKYLLRLEEELIYYDADTNDADYAFLIKKAVQFRDTLKKINQQLDESQS